MKLICKEIRTHNNLVRQRTLKHLAKLAKWLNYVVKTYLYGAFDCMFLSYHVRVSERVYTLQLPECQTNPCSKQARHSGNYKVWIHSEMRAWHDMKLNI